MSKWIKSIFRGMSWWVHRAHHAAKDLWGRDFSRVNTRLQHTHQRPKPLALSGMFARSLLAMILSGTYVFGADPGGVSGSELWLKADAGVHGGSTVSQWDDQSGNNRNAVQANSTYYPTYSTDNEANFNPRLHFTDHFLDVPYASQLNGADLTVFVVVDLDGGSSWRSPWTTRDDYPSRGHILYYNGGYRYWTGRGTNGGWDQLNHGNTSNNYEILTTTSRSNNSNITKSIYLQGRYLGYQTVQFSPNTQRPFRVGKGATERTNGAYPWYGDISEVIVYSQRLSSYNRTKIESYLAIKYGITLDQSGNGKNYRDSGGTRIWRVSNNSGYGNDIAGLGKDDVSMLDQKISKSINTDAVITMATSSDFSSSNLNNARPILSAQNRRFLMWSNDDGDHGWTNTGAPAGGKILERKWKVQKTKSNQRNVSIQVDTNDPDFDINNFSGKLYFVKGTDLSATTPVAMVNDGGGKWHIDNVNFDDGDLFSFVVEPVFMNITKTSIVVSDPANNTTNPKRIPGAEIRYCFTVENNGTGTADTAVIHDKLDSTGNRDKLSYKQAGKGSVVSNNNACSESDCRELNDTTAGSYDNNTKEVTVSMDDIPANSHECAYIDVEVK